MQTDANEMQTKCKQMKIDLDCLRAAALKLPDWMTKEKPGVKPGKTIVLDC